MNFDDWEPAYEAILADFGYARAADEDARDRLAARLAGTDPLSTDSLRVDDATVTVDGATVAIAGAAPSLAEETDVAAAADAVFAASSAATVLEDAGVTVDCLVTDLDGDPEFARQLTERDTPVAVHAHGDNVSALEEHVPAMNASAVLPTTQAAPVGQVVNAGGFTDGDRAAFLADHCGADALVFPGWDFDDPTVDPVKARKLAWAERLLYWLETRRRERFSVLDGRRGEIETGTLPPASGTGS